MFLCYIIIQLFSYDKMPLYIDRLIHKKILCMLFKVVYNEEVRAQLIE